MSRSVRRIGIAAAMLALQLALAAAVAVAGDFVPDGPPRELKGAPGIYESRFEAVRGPSPFDKIALHRVAAGSKPLENPAAVLLFLPGTNMNGEVGVDDPRHNLLVYLAGKGVETWALDYRTHFIPPATSESDLSELKGWTNELFESDIDAAGAFVSASTHRKKLFVGGFSRGVTFAYLYAARHPDRVEGLVMLDGSISDHPMMVRPSSSPLPNADDVGGKHLTYDKRKVLMQMVIANPDGPAPIPKYHTARENLEHVLYDAPAFGGSGGLANPIGGFSDAPTLARVLVQDDRWWPSVQNYESPLTPELKQSLAGSKIPVIAFGSTGGQTWSPGTRFTSETRVAASSTGSSDATYTALNGWGHLDVLCGTKAESEVYAPIAAWIMRLTPRAK